MNRLGLEGFENSKLPKKIKKWQKNEKKYFSVPER